MCVQAGKVCFPLVVVLSVFQWCVLDFGEHVMS